MHHAISTLRRVDTKPCDENIALSAHEKNVRPQQQMVVEELHREP